jgi:hypothetical protein
MYIVIRQNIKYLHWTSAVASGVCSFLTTTLLLFYTPVDTEPLLTAPQPFVQIYTQAQQVRGVGDFELGLHTCRFTYFVFGLFRIFHTRFGRFWLRYIFNGER